MSSGKAAWRILRPKTKDGISLVRWTGDDDKRIKQRKAQQEFCDKLAQFLRDNGYSATIVGPFPALEIEVN